MCEKNDVDVSSFYFLEATGDSETDSVDDPNIATTDPDDAESCSYDLSDSPNDHNQVNGCDADDYIEEQVEEEADNNGYSSPPDEQQQHYGVPMDRKSSASVDSTQEEGMSEMEKNRLFWEACLAS